MTTSTLTDFLLERLQLVQRETSSHTPPAADPNCRLADVLDSMGMVEFLMVVAADCGVDLGVIEECVGRSFTTVAELAAAMEGAGVGPSATRGASCLQFDRVRSPAAVKCWLAGCAVRLPAMIQLASAINEALQRPPGWIEQHAGILQRRLWADEDPLHAAAEAARACLREAGVLEEEVGALLVTSEAPPRLLGLAAAMHHRLDLRPQTPALEVGAACTSFLAALWLGRALLPACGAVLIVALEAPSRFLTLQPGPAGEAAALFGDVAAACVLTPEAVGTGSVPLHALALGADGSAGDLVRVESSAAGAVEVCLQGQALATRAVRTMTAAVQSMVEQHGLTVADLEVIVIHGGNGRFPALLARQLRLPRERIWSETATTGNLGSASLPVAWAAHATPRGAAVWAAVGAGLTWGTALLGPR
jgi:3-oxoacyl-[acyl-carrier-protein] synthase-3